MSIQHNRSLIVTAAGDSSVLHVQDRPIEGAGPGQLLVEAAASGVNFIEIYQREGVYPVPMPFGLGSEGAGRIVEMGVDVAGFSVGDVVAWESAPASHSQLVLVAAQKAVPVPAEVDPETAAAAMLQGITAHYLVNSTYPVQPGDAVLVHAAAGGVGQLLVQMAKSKGAFVVGTVSTDAKAEIARGVGADAVVRYDEIDSSDALAAAIRDANGGRAMSVVYDGIGRATFDASLASLVPRGMLVLFGGASGQVPPFDLQRLNRAGSVYVTRPTIVHYVATRDELLWRGTDVLATIADGALRIDIGRRYRLEDAARAYDDLQGRRTTGKLLLTR